VARRGRQPLRWHSNRFAAGTLANSARVHATTLHVVAAHFADERASLKPLPAGPFQAVLRLERRVTRDGMVSVGGNLYSVPDCTRKRAVEVHTLTREVHIFEEGRQIAAHPVLEGRGQRLIAGGHRQHRPPPNSTTPRQAHPRQAPPMPLRSGDVVARRPLEIYAVVGQRLADGATT